MSPAARRIELPPQRSATARAPAGGARAPADVVLPLHGQYGNRRLARSLSRRLARQPRAAARPSWAEQTTVENRPLAKQIDELERLGAQELIRRRAEALAAASAWDDDKHGEHERTLEAIEFLAAEHGLKPLEVDGRHPSSLPRAVARRRDVRLVIEEGVRQFGSLEKSITTMTNISGDMRGDVDFFEKEADEFGLEFHRQAKAIALQMLAQSANEIVDVAESYGLRRSTAVDAGNRIIHGHDVDEVVRELVEHPAVWAPEPADAGADRTKWSPERKHRTSLAEHVKALKRQQRIVHDRWQALQAATAPAVDDPYDAAKGEAQAAAYQRWHKSVEHLAAMWAESERAHPVLASARGGERNLEDVALGALDDDQHGSEPQMTAMLTDLLPKLADIGRIQGRIKSYTPGGSAGLDPLSLPPVVAVTKAVMFVPEGTIRAGKVYDLVEAAQDKSVAKYIAEGLLALIVLATLIPSGGASLGVGIGMLGAALSTASAIEDWEHYKKQKLLANTALDRAKALSAEDPSLLPFALDLVSLGFDGLPLVKAFAKGAELRNLVRAGEGAKDAGVKKVVGELDDLGKGQGNAHLGEDALEEARAEGRKPGASKSEASEPEKDAGASEKASQKTAKVRAPPGSDYQSAQELRTAVRAHLGTLEHAIPNEEWTELWSQVDRAALLKAHPGDKYLLSRIDRVYATVRDPRAIEDAMAALWETAAREGITEQEALLRWAGGEPFPKVTNQDEKLFRDALRKDKPFVDEYFRGGAHGAYTHMFQEYVVARALGGRREAMLFRQAIAGAEGPAAGGREFFSRVWDAVFDGYAEGEINTPEELGTILKIHLGFEGGVP